MNVGIVKCVGEEEIGLDENSAEDDRDRNTSDKSGDSHPW